MKIELQALLLEAQEKIMLLKEYAQRNPSHAVILKTNTIDGKRSLMMRSNLQNLMRIQVKIGSIMNDLRTVLDNLFFAIVRPYAPNESFLRRVQFPIAKDKADLDNKESIRLTMDKVPALYQAIVNLAPYTGANGHKGIQIVTELDNIKKHRHPNRLTSYVMIRSTEALIRVAPDYPHAFQIVHSKFRSNRGQPIISWHQHEFKGARLAGQVIPTTHLYEMPVTLALLEMVTCEKYQSTQIYIENAPISRFEFNVNIDQLYGFIADLVKEWSPFIPNDINRA